MERQLFGAQGAGAFAVLSDPAVMQQIQALKEEMPNFKTGASFFEDYSKNSPVQQWRDAWADLQKVLMDIGKEALPPVTAGLTIIDNQLKRIGAVLPQGPQAQKFGGGAVAGAMVGGAVGLPFGVPWAGAGVGALAGADLSTSQRVRPGLLEAPLNAVRLIEQLWDRLTAEKPIQVSTVINLDGRKIAEAITSHQAKEGAGPAQGAPYHDSTYSTAPIDFAYP